MSVFGSYKIRSQNAAPKTNPVPVADLVQRYLSFVDTVTHTEQEGEEAGTLPWSLVKTKSDFEPLQPFFEYLYSAPCTSAPVERVFSHGGIFMRPHRASMSDKLLCDLMLSKCND